MRSVESPYETEAPKLRDSVKITVDEFINKLESAHGDLDIARDNLDEKIKLIGECGVDYISSGALTHSVYNMDLSLKAI